MGNEAISATTIPASQPINIDPVTSTKPTQKPQEKDTISYCCSPCFQGIWRHVCNFFVAIWNFICCKCTKSSKSTSPSPDPIQPPQQEDPSRNEWDRILTNRYENEDKPNYENLEQVNLLIGSSLRYQYIEFLFELTDVEYEPKRLAVPIDTIKAIIRKIKRPDVDAEPMIEVCIQLCDVCGKEDRNYAVVREKIHDTITVIRGIKLPHDVAGPLVEQCMELCDTCTTNNDYTPLRQKLHEIALLVRNMRLTATENTLIQECLELCDTEACARDKDYSALREKLLELDEELRPPEHVALSDEKR